MFPFFVGNWQFCGTCRIGLGSIVSFFADGQKMSETTIYALWREVLEVDTQ